MNVEGAREGEMRTNPKLKDAISEARDRAERRCRRDGVTARLRITVAYHETETSMDTADLEQVHQDRDSGGESDMSDADQETDLRSWNRPGEIERHHRPARPVEEGLEASSRQLTPRGRGTGEKPSRGKRQMERVVRYAAERGLDVPDTGGARGGEAGRRPVEEGVGGDGEHGAPDHPLGGGGGDTEEGMIHCEREVRGPGEEGVPEHEDVLEFYSGTGERMEDLRRREGKRPATEGSSKRKKGGTDLAATPARKRLRQQKVTDVYGGEWVARHKKAFLRWLYSSGVSFNAFLNQAWKAYQQVLLEQPGSSPRAVLPNHNEIASMWAVETHRAKMAEELEEFGAGAPELQQCALRVMHMWSCASPADRSWAVHEGIHTKKRNQLAFEKVVQLVEITANVRLTEYHRVGCGYVLSWQRDEGMLDCQAGLKVEPVRSGTHRGMTEEEIARQVALITLDPIEASAPPSADAVFGRRACIFRPYPKEDDSDEEPVPEAADDPALCIPREIDETHDDSDDDETRAHTARRAANRADREMLGGEEEFWGPFGKVASTGGPEERATTPTPTRRESSIPPPSAPSPAPPSSVSPFQSATATADMEELGVSLTLIA
ncbi:hypothetical protein CBR_g28083 [Chara braunii]|uniref:HAT C-terminal dimerisation domain-containing protein n=1 Tax=Chara braunii TaxID=69332 RepID=A0A388L996_CHABU|nr:hypothetical protein CBR_g28083 [Chara braunii]|eukprot:GBG78858.1 hypothetical protein CBR_g28083 [Chara braunii]